MLVISVSSLKGGVGKTSVALGLASAAHNRGIPTLVIDMDPQADASTGLDVPVTTPLDIADVLSAPKQKIVKQAIVPSGWSGSAKGLLDVIPGSPRSAEFDRPTLSERFLRRLRDALATIEDDYRLVIIDCPPSMNGLTRAAWLASQRVAVVTEPGLFSVAAADRALRAIAELRRRGAPDLQPLGLIANRVRTKSREHGFRIDEMREMFGPLVLTPPIGERTVLQQAQGSARPIHTWPGQSASELAGAFDSLLDRALRTSTIRTRGQKRTGSAAADASSPDTPQAGQAPETDSRQEPAVQDATGSTSTGPQHDPTAAEGASSADTQAAGTGDQPTAPEQTAADDTSDPTAAEQTATEQTATGQTDADPSVTDQTAGTPSPGTTPGSLGLRRRDRR